MTDRVDDARLVAYADGELSAAEAKEIEAALAVDDALRANLRRLREAGALVRASYGDIMNEPVPEGLHAAIEEAFSQEPRLEGREAAESPGGRGFWPALAAASIAALVIGLAGGYWTADRQFRSDLAQRELQFQRDRLAMEEAVSAALEKHVSGETLRWENAESGSHASITPVRTFKNSDGRWCREYLHDSEIGQESATRRAIACRIEQGTWRTQLVALEAYLNG